MLFSVVNLLEFVEKLLTLIVDTNISQSSAATHLKCGGRFSDSIIAIFPQFW